MANNGWSRRNQIRRAKPEHYYYRVFNCPNWKLEQMMKVIDLLDSELAAQNLILKNKQRERALRTEILNLKLKICHQSSVLFEKYFKTFHRSWDSSANSYKTLSKEITNRRKEIKVLNSEIVQLGTIRSATEKRVVNVKLVKDFMGAVCVESKGEFSSADDVIKRFEFLFKTREAQIEQIAETDRKMESLRHLLHDSTIEDETALLVLEMKVLEVKRQRANLEAKLQGLHEKLLDRKVFLVDKMTKVPILETAITDMYIRVCKQLNENPDLTLPITDQMEYIQVAFKQILGMRKDAHQMIGPVSDIATRKASIKSSTSIKI